MTTFCLFQSSVFEKFHEQLNTCMNAYLSERGLRARALCRVTADVRILPVLRGAGAE